jgi:hypothetical protein
MNGRHLCRLALASRRARAYRPALAWGVALAGLLILSTAQGGWAATAQE